MNRTIAVFLASILHAAIVMGQAAPAPPRVLLVSCDGLRPDAIDLADAPVMQHLIATGSYQATCLDEMPSVTLPNHASMVTGLGVARHGITANTTLPGRIAATTIFDAATAGGRRVGFFVGKGKLGYLCPEGSVNAWREEGDLDALTDAVVAAIENDDLHLLFVHFGATDAAGHTYGWMSREYLAAVSDVDAAIGRIIESLDRAGVLEQTAILVSADHGGHWNTHGFDIPDDRFIPFILTGPGIASGRRLCEQVRIMDAAATSLYLLGLPTNSAIDGRPVLEALMENDQTPCSPPPVAFTGLCAPFPLFAAAPLVMMWRWRGTFKCRSLHEQI